jgi:hypothetical protein
VGRPRLCSDLIGKFFFRLLVCGGGASAGMLEWVGGRVRQSKRRDGDVVDRGHYGLICVVGFSSLIRPR